MLMGRVIPEIVEQVFAGVKAAQTAGFLVSYPSEIEIEVADLYNSKVTVRLPIKGRMSPETLAAVNRHLDCRGVDSGAGVGAVRQEEVS